MTTGEDKQNEQPTSNLVIPTVREPNGMGHDIFSLLLQKRQIVVTGQVNEQMAAIISAELLFLQSQSKTDPITMIINSPGGSVYDGLAIYDTMRQPGMPKIVTIGVGMQASMGSVLLAGGDERYMTENSSLMIHQVSAGSSGQHTDMELTNASVAEVHEKLKNIYVEFTGLRHEFWDQVGERDTWLSAKQAVKLGFINGIVGIDAVTGEDKKTHGKYASEAKRPVGLSNIFNNVAKLMINEMSPAEILPKLNNGQANEAEWGRYRPELVMRLSEFSEYWVEGRKSEYQAAHEGKLPANDTTSKPVTDEIRGIVQKNLAKLG